jgi:hypothetical protein
MSYRYERLSDDNIINLICLYKKCFNVKVTLKELNRKYATEYTGIKHVGYLCFAENNSIAGYYGVFPCIIKTKDARLVGAQSGDTMTHPDHQGKGLFTGLAKKTYELSKELQIKFVFGFPNQNSYPGFIKKLNWKDQETMKVLKIKIVTFPLKKIVGRIGLVKPFSNFITKIVFRKYLIDKSEISQFLMTTEHCEIEKSLNYFTYKLNSTHTICKIDGVVFFLKILNNVWIGDFIITQEGNLVKAIRKLKFLSSLCGSSDVTFIGSLGHTKTQQLLSTQLFLEKDHLPYCYLDDKQDFVPDLKFVGFDFDTF